MTEAPSAYEIREELLDTVVSDLLGPANGDDEELVEYAPTQRYLVGQLAPRGALIDPAEFDERTQAGDTTNDDGEPETDTPQTHSLMPSSSGMTFAVDGSASSISVKAEWGEYIRTESETLETETGRPKTVWKREPAGGEAELRLADGAIEPFNPDETRDKVFVQGRARRSADRNWIVTLFLVNGNEIPESLRDAAWLFQPKLEVTSPDGAAIFRRRPQALRAVSGLFASPEQGEMDMAYREFVEFAVGHGVSVQVEPSDLDPERAVAIQTSVIPRYDVPKTEPPTEEDYGLRFPDFEKTELDMKTLSELNSAQLRTALEPVAASYRAWITSNSARLESGADRLDQHREAGESARRHWEKALHRLEEGIETLENDDAAEAFRIANEAMWLQRTHSELVLRRRRGEEVDIEAIDVPVNRSWYPFQLAFILIALASATDPTHPDRVDRSEAIADLLWFPTGGGKTEAYLGLAAYVMALRRLQGFVGDLDGSDGVAVIMRYTLRLLTIQQFQRATALMCALDVIRRDRAKEGDERLGETPFRIGLWVGRRATPNTTDQAREAVKDAHGDQWRGGYGSGTPAQLTNCPWCGAEISPGRDIKVDSNVDRTLTFCSDRLGRCEFTPKQAPGEGLPIVVVDEEIYRLLPTLLIATVDKFAQMPWRGEVQTLFGRVSGLCERHGFLTPESPDTGRHPKRGQLPATRRIDAPMLRPPDLIIQDELHLISGPLGSLVGLYETAIDELCTWELDGQRVRPKVIASTATIRNATDQVHGLFLRSVDIFPPPGLDVADNFFALRREPSPQTPGRRYIGVCAPGRDRPTVLLRVYVAFLCAASPSSRSTANTAPSRTRG